MNNNPHSLAELLAFLSWIEEYAIDFRGRLSTLTEAELHNLILWWREASN